MSRLCGKDRPRKGQRSPPNTTPNNYYNDDDDHLFAGLSEVTVPPPVQNTDDSAHTHTHHTLEDAVLERPRG